MLGARSASLDTQCEGIINQNGTNLSPPKMHQILPHKNVNNKISQEIVKEQKVYKKKTNKL
jgi:hypothetical protein